MEARDRARGGTQEDHRLLQAHRGKLTLRVFAALLSSFLTLSCEAGEGLGFGLGDEGLTSLSYAGRELLANPGNGNVRPVGHTPRIERADGAVEEPLDKPRSTRDPKAAAITQQFSWGVIECAYSQRGERIALDLRVTNTSEDSVIQALDLDLLDLSFGEIPTGRVLEAGMWGTGGTFHPLHDFPLVAKSEQMPPAIFVNFEGGAIAFTNDGDPRAPDRATVAIPFTSDPTTRLSYPFRVSFAPIAPGKTARARLSLRFGPFGASAATLAGDVLRRYRDAYPYSLRWRDHRPIGALFLATSQKHPEKNPRGWFLNAADVDLTTPEGLAKWRARLMKYADDSIRILKDLGAQGMITWDPEGQEFPGATFYGDPRLAPRLAPETDLAGDGSLGALDEYFRKFREAGLRTGITLRPQSIEFREGVPFQRMSDDPATELLERIEYARKRWGCTLFYIDSTFGKVDALDADIFERIARRHPDILLMPENENFRYFAYSAPLNSFHHHGVTSTPESVREVYDRAFSTILATTTEDKMRAGRAALVESVRHGDILIVNAWYGGKHIDFVKDVYQEAARR